MVTVEKNRLGEAGALAVLFFACLVLFYRALVAGPDQIIGGIDISQMFYNYKLLVKEAFLEGHLPLWNPHCYGGYPFAAAPGAATYYPPDFIFLVMPIARAANVSLFLHLVLAGVFMFCWMRNFESVGSSLAGAFVFMFCGFLTSRLAAGHFSIVRTSVYIPLMFLFLEKAMTTGKKRWWIFSGFAIGMQLMVGHPQMAYYSLLFLGVYALCRHFSLGKKLISKDTLRFVGFIGGMYLFGLATSAISLLPMLEFSRFSDRVVTDFDYVSSMSMHPVRLVHLLFPNPSIFLSKGVLWNHWEWNHYLGILPLCLVMLAIVSRRRHASIIAILGAAALVISLGKYTPLFKGLYYLVPGMKLFRIHSRCLIVFTFFLATLAGMGMGVLFEADARRKRWAHKVVFAVWCVLALALAVLLFLSPNSFFKVIWDPVTGTMDRTAPLRISDPEVSLPILLVFITIPVLGITFWRRSKSAWMKPIILAIIALDLLTTAWNHVGVNDVSSQIGAAQFPDSIRGSSGKFRVFFPREILMPNSAIFYNVDNINGYTPLMLIRTASYIEAATDVRPFRSNSDYTLNKKFFADGKPFRCEILNIHFSANRNSATGEFELIENPSPFPRALWIRRAEAVSSGEELLARLVADDFDPYQTVLLEKDPGTEAAPDADSVQWAPAEVTDYGIEGVTVKVDAPDDGWLLLSELFYPGWKATSDDKPLEVYRADYLLRAVRVSRGEHTIVFRFEPVSFKVGAAFSLVSLTIFLAMLILPRRRFRDDSMQPPSGQQAASNADNGSNKLSGGCMRGS